MTDTELPRKASGRARVLKALKQVREQGPLNHKVGICAAVVAYEGESVRELMSNDMDDSDWAGWPLWSGDQDYPVPGAGRLSAHDMFAVEDDLWNRRKKYGRLRWALLDHLIDFYERVMDQ